MALGYCSVCQKLVSIVPKEKKYPGSRESNWYPVYHKFCPGWMIPV